MYSIIGICWLNMKYYRNAPNHIDQISIFTRIRDFTETIYATLKVYIAYDICDVTHTHAHVNSTHLWWWWERYDNSVEYAQRRQAKCLFRAAQKRALPSIQPSGSMRFFVGESKTDVKVTYHSLDYSEYARIRTTHCRLRSTLLCYILLVFAY